MKRLLTKSINRISIIIFFIAFISSCDNSPAVDCFNEWEPKSLDSCNHTSFIYDDFTIKILDKDSLPYIIDAREFSPRDVYDKDSVPLFVFHEESYYHPISIAQYSFEVFNLYYTSGDPDHLSYLQTLGNNLIEEALLIDSALYFPYHFDFTLHKCPNETLISPWFSAMAQGQVLSLFCRLYEETRDSLYLAYSDMIYESLIRTKGDGFIPWVTCIDSSEHLWFEEYPRELPAYTLNGMIFAIYGIYDYYRLTDNIYALEVLKAAITTIKTHIHLYRNEEDISYYCLKHKLKNLDYHNIHIHQLHMLFEITGDSYFEEMSLKFTEDTKKME